MNTAKVQPEDYVQFLLGSPLQFSCTEAARVQPDEPDPPAHDSFTRLLTRLEPDAEALWEEAQPQVRKDDGVLVLDDSTLDKPYARKMGLVGWHWSGKHHAVVKGINLLTLVWTDGDRHVPCDYRIYDKAHDGFSKNDLFTQMLPVRRSNAAAPSVSVSIVGTAVWRTCSLDWTWLGRLKSNRNVYRFRATPADRHGGHSRARTGGSFAGLRPDSRVLGGRHRRRRGALRPTTLGMDALTRLQYGEFPGGSRRSPGASAVLRGRALPSLARPGRARKRNHIGLSIRAFLRMECHCYTLGLSWFQAKLDVIRNAVRGYLFANPSMRLQQAA